MICSDCNRQIVGKAHFIETDFVVCGKCLSEVTDDYQTLQSMKLVQVLPCGDLHPHIECDLCDCLPVERDGVLIHSAFDGREFDEMAEAVATGG